MRRERVLVLEAQGCPLTHPFHYCACMHACMHVCMQVGLLGGSISYGMIASNRHTHAFFPILANLLRQAFPASNVTSRNGAMGSTRASFALVCLETRLDRDVDLVLVEYR